jgi:hypothetical protein
VSIGVRVGRGVWVTVGEGAAVAVGVGMGEGVSVSVGGGVGAGSPGSRKVEHANALSSKQAATSPAAVLWYGLCMALIPSGVCLRLALDGCAAERL